MNGAYSTCIPQVTANADAVHTEPLYMEYIRYEVDVYIQVLIVLHDDGVVDVYTNCMCYMYTLHLYLFKYIHTCLRYHTIITFNSCFGRKVPHQYSCYSLASQTVTQPQVEEHRL